MHIVRLNLYKAFEYIHLRKNNSTLDCDLALEHFREGTTINSPHCQEFMV